MFSCLVMVLVLGARPAAAPELAPGVSCDLEKSVKVSAKAKGKGRKTRLDEGTQVTVTEVDGKWAYVRGDFDEGWIQLKQLERRCGELRAPEPVQAPAPEPKPLEVSSDAPVPPAVLEDLVFGAASGPMTPNVPEGTHTCSYGDLKECPAQCELGHAESCFLAAEQQRALLPPPPVPPESHRRVAALYTRGCNRNHAESCVRLGEMYELGEGLPMADPVVMRIYKGACAGGAARACTRLGFIYLAGEGVKADVAQARAYYQRGCDGGSEQGCTGLGSLVQRDDPTLAAQLFERGCGGAPRLGAQGCANLGYAYESGTGVIIDLVRAKDLYRQGCTGGAAYACERLQALGEPLPEPPPQPPAQPATSG